MSIGPWYLWKYLNAVFYEKCEGSNTMSEKKEVKKPKSKTVKKEKAESTLKETEKKTAKKTAARKTK